MKQWHTAPDSGDITLDNDVLEHRRKLLSFVQNASMFLSCMDVSVDLDVNPLVVKTQEENVQTFLV